LHSCNNDNYQQITTLSAYTGKSRCCTEDLQTVQRIPYQPASVGNTVVGLLWQTLCATDRILSSGRHSWNGRSQRRKNKPAKAYKAYCMPSRFSLTTNVNRTTASDFSDC